VDDEFKLSGDTIRNLEVLAHAPGELRYRMALVQAIKDLRRETAMMRAEHREQFAKLEKGQLGYRDVAKIAKTEIGADKGIAQLQVDVKRLWSAGVWIVTLILAAVIGAALTKLLVH
jgi:hypothetical protein